MKVYLFISNHKKLLKMYLPYIEALNKQLDITNSPVDADIVLVIGAWTWQGSPDSQESKADGHSLHRLSTRRYF